MLGNMHQDEYIMTKGNTLSNALIYFLVQMLSFDMNKNLHFHKLSITEYIVYLLPIQ